MMKNKEYNMSYNNKNKIKKSKKIRTYCAQCFSNCPAVAHIENDKFTRVTADREHKFYRPLCPKGLAGPEMVYNNARLEYPLERTNPKGAADPGWKRISWEKALDTIAEKMGKIKTRYGAEAFVFSQTNVSSPLWEITSFIRRLSNLYGTPNHMTTTHICNWHRDNGSALTFGKPGDDFAAGWPDFNNSKCILIWGHNPNATFNALNWQIKTAQKRGALVIVIDPRLTDIAAKSDIWLQVKPGTDGALALGMIHLMLKHRLFDDRFIREWTNAPLLVKSDTKDLLRVSFVDSSEDNQDLFYLIDPADNRPVPHKPGSKPDFIPCLEGKGFVRLANGENVEYKTVFTLLKESVAMYTPEFIEQHTSVPMGLLEKTIRMIAQNSPTCWYSFNGIEQNLNATQTNRAICTFYALTGDYDKKGGNTIHSPIPPMAYPFGFEFVTPDMLKKNIAITKHPLGPAGTIMAVPPYLICKAIERADPFQVKGLIVFGANTISANPDSKMTANALKKLDFHVHIDLTINPTAEFADIVLPSASFWETGRIGYPLEFQDNKWVLQWREPAAEPRGESKDELWIIFELAKRLGFTDKFWNGSIEKAFESMLEPTKIKLKDLKKADGGIFIQEPLEYQKYKKKGFGSMSGRIELFSQLLKDIGQAPLPEWKNPYEIFQKAGISRADYPFLLITSKLRGYCHSQHRGIPSLRKQNPHPFLEINKNKAEEMGFTDGESIILKTVHGQITLEARLTDGIAPDVVCTQHGWWQACTELGLPGHDIYSSKGSNVNLLFKNDFTDPISGSVHMRGFPCNINKHHSSGSGSVGFCTGEDTKQIII
jgi:anaerobic selenocysteine-containing dehydrogenase